MSEDQTIPVGSPDNSSELKAELDAMRRKNAELLDEYKKISTQIKNVPDGVDIQELIEFKHKASSNQRASMRKRDKLWSSSSVRRRKKRTSASRI